MNANPYSQFLLRVRGPRVNVDYPLPWGYISIGRSPECSLPIDDPKLAANGQLHIGCTAQGGWLLDRNSRGSMLRNGAPLAQDVAAPLVVGDIYMLGDHSLEVVAYPPPPEAAPPAASQEARPDAAPSDERRSAEPLTPKPLAPASPPLAARPGVVRKPRNPLAAPQLYPLEEVLPRESVCFVHYLPELYSRREADPSASNPCAPGFMARFLGLFESLYLPVEWTVANFDLRLDLRTAQAEFLTWWERWFDLHAGDGWSTQQRRDLLAKAFDLFGRRGTRSALAQALELFTGYAPEIQDQGADLPLHTFRVRVYLDAETDPAPIAGLIDLFKPAHTTYELTCVALMPADADVSATGARESNDKAKHALQ